MNSRVGWLGIVLSAVMFGNTRLAQQPRATNTQAVIWVVTDQPGNCTYRISEAPLSPTYAPVHDLDTSLFSGANSDARPGSVVLGNNHWFVAGTRKADLAGDGKWYSRALAQDTAHYGGVTCGMDAEVPFQFTTSTIPAGLTHTDPLPFDSRALGNYAIPTFDFTDLTKMYVDPQTGFKFRMLTGPGQYPVQTVLITGSLASTYSPGSVNGEVLASNNWTNPNSCLVVDGSMCSYSAAGQDVLMLRLAATCGPGGYACFHTSWEGMGTGEWDGASVDSYQLALTCNGGGSAIQTDVAYSWNGVSQGSEWEPQTCPSSTGAVTYPSSLNGGGLSAWQSPNYPLIPAVFWQATQGNFTVNTSGTAVTQTGGMLFSLDPRILTAGSKITIGGTEYTIASVNSATSLTLTASAGNQTNVAASTDNFSVMIRKHSASAGTLNVDGATVTEAWSDNYYNGRAGFQMHCSALTSTDAQGHVGRFCLFPDYVFAGGGLYWVTNDLQVRFIGRGYLPASSIGVPADEYNSFINGYVAQSQFDSNDPNSWWVASSLTSNSHPTLVKVTYNPSGASGCSQTANYQALPIDPSYNQSNALNCNITYSELTRPSQGKDIWSQLPSTITSGKFPYPFLEFVQDGYAILDARQGQDHEAWLISVNLSTGMVSGTYSTYMNQAANTGSWPCRACVLHGTVPIDPSSPYYALAFNNYFGTSDTGGGPYQITVNTPLAAVPSISTASCQSMISDPTVSWLIQYGSGCDTITLAGSDNIPCDPTPSSWESANMPACTWQTGWTQWQAGALKPGDTIQDAATGLETIAFLKNTGGTTWLVLRNPWAPQGPLMTPPSGTSAYLKAHAANWTGNLICNFQGNAIVSVGEANGQGLMWDRRFAAFNHGALRAGGSIVADYYNGLGTAESARLGNYPGALNTPVTARILNGAAFAGKTGVGGLNYTQSHLGWDGNPNSFVDYAPLAPPQGGNFQLWPQSGVVNVTGSLYKIPAASAFIAPIKRFLGEAVWSGMYNFQDVSGTGSIGGTSADNFKYCSIDYPGATCGQSGEAAGDLFVNIPQATVDGNTGGAYDFNRVNAAPLGQEPLAVLQYYFGHLNGASTENFGRWERRITTAFGRYNGQDTYSNAKLIPNSNLLVFDCSTANLQRLEDLCVGQMPQDPPETPDYGNGFFQIAIPANPNAPYAEIQFGYAENGPVSSFFCTSRQEACNTSSPNGTPFNWEGEPRTLEHCSGGCVITVNAIPDRVVYYRLRWSNDGTTWNNSSIGIAISLPNSQIGKR